MCDLGYQERFDSISPEVRKSYIEALAFATGDDFINNKPVLGLISLLNETEFECFIARLASRAPFEASLAWNIIHLSSHGLGSWFFERGKAGFQRCFHLHPKIAPLLIQAAIRPDSEEKDIIALFDFYGSTAADYPVLRAAQPIWNAELIRREQERIFHEEKKQSELRRQEIEKLEWIGKITAITNEGPAAILQTLANASTLKTWRFPVYWADIPDFKLRDLSSDLLMQALSSLCNHAEARCWRCLAHKVQGAIQTIKRGAEVDRLDSLSLMERLQAVCNSRWSSTYYPSEWAEELLLVINEIPVELQKDLRAKLMRLNSRGPWRTVRQKLRCKQQHEAIGAGFAESAQKHKIERPL